MTPATKNRRAPSAHAEPLTAMGGYGLPVPNIAEFGVTDPQVEIRATNDPHSGPATSPLLDWLTDDRERPRPFIDTML